MGEGDYGEELHMGSESGLESSYFGGKCEVKLCECGLELEYLGRFKEDNRRVWACRKCDRAWAENVIPTTLYGPTHTEIAQFEEEHQDAEACPKCGYKFLVTGSGIHLSMVDGGCCVCSRLSGETANE